MTTRAAIDGFLACRRLAVVGVSRSNRDFTRLLFREFVKRGYDVVPVNPGVEEVEGRRCYPRVSAIAPGVEGALILTPSGASESVVRDCAASGVPRVWLYRAVGKGAVSPAAVEVCREKGIALAEGCPFMFFPTPGFPHNLHGLFLKLTGSFPK